MNFNELKLIQVQAATGLIFASFSTLHLLTSISSNFGEHYFNSVLHVARKYYNFPLIEPVIVISGLTHLIVGGIRGYRRSKINANISLSKEIITK